MDIFTVREPKANKLELKNEGGLSLFFIGIGGAFTRSLNQTNLLIIKGDDHLLVDCGAKTPQALHELGVEITEIKNVFITHSHSDHIGGMEELILKNRYITKTKPNIIINETYQHLLWDMSLRGGCAFNEKNANDVLAFHDFFNIVRPRYLHRYPRETMEAQIGGINLKIMRTKHIPNTSNSWESSFWSCGIIIDNRVLFTADTRFDSDLLHDYDTLFSFEMIFHDCQFYTGGIHASLEELSGLPREFKQKILLTHYGDDWRDFTDEIERQGFKGLTRQQVYYDFKRPG
jgi:ribonuclease BN (tRNA processing enzyme)